MNGYVHPTVWRRVEVAPTITIRQLHDIVQAAMGWENYHLWDMGIEPARTLIDVADIGTEFGYLYDFGDEWRHAIVIEKAVAMKSGHPYPTCIGGSNACPPEDCGGPYGYREFLKIVRGPDTYEREELLEVYGGKFNPKKFDIDVANENLKDLIDASKEN